MVRFYGQSYDYWIDQDMKMIQDATNAMDEIQASEDLRMIQTTSFSSLKKDDREKMHKQLMKRANPDLLKPKPVSASDLARLLGRGP